MSRKAPLPTRVQDRGQGLNSGRQKSARPDTLRFGANNSSGDSSSAGLWIVAATSHHREHRSMRRDRPAFALAEQGHRHRPLPVPNPRAQRGLAGTRTHSDTCSPLPKPTRTAPSQPSVGTGYDVHWPAEGSLRSRPPTELPPPLHECRDRERSEGDDCTLTNHSRDDCVHRHCRLRRCLL